MSVTPEQLSKLGVLCWRLDADAYRTDPKLRAIREARGYSYEVRCVRAGWTPLVVVAGSKCNMCLSCTFRKVCLFCGTM